MPIASMTGFARGEGRDADLHWAWEVKSVNGRNLDVRCRLPLGFEALEPGTRAAIADHCKRGNVSVLLTVSRGQQPPRIRINREVLDRLLAVVGELEGRIEAAPARLDGLLAVRGVVELVEEEDLAEDAREARNAAIMATLAQALGALRAMRNEEGGRLGALVAAHLQAIDRLCKEAGACAAAQPAAIKTRLKAQLDMLLDQAPALSEERLAQEAALLATKADVREELDRLAAHVEAVRALAAAGGPIGRRLDFICQEFNREANTLCSKSADVELTRIGLELKSVIDQLREQVQNIE